MRVYRKVLSSVRVISLPDVWRCMASAPSSRFWVSEERASVIITLLDRGGSISNMRPLKREMYLEIYRRVQLLRSQSPGLSTYQCCIKVVNSPAPKFYMTPLSIRETIYKIKRKWYENRRRKYRP